MIYDKPINESVIASNKDKTSQIQWWTQLTYATSWLMYHECKSFKKRGGRVDKQSFKGGVQRLLTLINNKGAWSKSGSKSYWITPCIDGNRNFDIFIENQGFFNYSNSSCAR